jgi:hypothetical protein
LPVISCCCSKCNKSFFLRDEMYIPLKNVRFSMRDNSDDPKTWQDWLLHLSAYCPDCRKPEIPENVWNDYLKIKGD